MKLLLLKGGSLWNQASNSYHIPKKEPFTLVMGPVVWVAEEWGSECVCICMCVCETDRSHRIGTCAPLSHTLTLISLATCKAEGNPTCKVNPLCPRNDIPPFRKALHWEVSSCHWNRKKMSPN